MSLRTMPLAAYYRRMRTYYRRWQKASALRLPLRHLWWEDPYSLWVQEETRILQAAQGAVTPEPARASQLTIAICIIVQDPVLLWLEESLASLRLQWHPQWELWLGLVGSAEAAQEFLPRAMRQEERIKTVIGKDLDVVVEKLNQRLKETKCEFLGFLGQHDVLAPHALAQGARYVQRQETDIVYADEDVIDERGQRSQPFCKPDWSPDLCLSSLYACRFAMYSRQLVQTGGGLRAEYGRYLDYDLLLRCTEQTSRILHLPQILYHRRQASVDVLCAAERGRGDEELGKQAVRDALQRRGETAMVESGPAPETFHIRRQVQGEPLVSILIPTRDRLKLLRSCIDSITQKTSYRRYEILIIDNGSREEQTLAYFAASPHRVLRYDEPFNFARLNNKAAAEARGAYLVLLNNDLEVISPDWLQTMLAHAQRREVGAVGAQLLYADGTIQHAGVVLGLRGVAGHAFKYLPSTEPGYQWWPQLTRNYSAVTAACLMTRKAVYEELGGMSERLAVTFNDVDFCLRLREQGYVIVYTPHARFYHHESRSRWRHAPREEEERYMQERWSALLTADPYYNPHLTLKREDFGFDRQRAGKLLVETFSQE